MTGRYFAAGFRVKMPLLNRPVAATLLSLLLLPFVPGTTWGQSIQRVVTVDSGLQFEGELAGVPEIIEGSGVFQAYGTQPIVRIDDGMRRVHVSFKRVLNIGESARNEMELPILQRPFPGGPGVGSIVNVGPFNEHGHRVLTVGLSGVAPVEYVQGITKITPRYCEVKTLVGTKTIPKQWKMKIGTGTVPPDVLRSVLRAQIRDPENPAEYRRIADFFLEARQYNRALEELRFILQIFPDLKEQLDDDRALIRQAYAQQILREVRLRLESGQTELGIAFANAFNMEGVAGETLAEFRDLETQIKNSKQQVEQTRDKITDLIATTQNLNQRQAEAVKQLQNELESDLSVVNAPRLDAYRRLADDASMAPQQKLALAISGWLLGSNNAIENLAVAQEMFEVRDLVIEYLAGNDTLRRAEILSRLAEFETGNPEYLDPLIKLLNPVDAPDLSQYTGEQPIEFFVELPGPKIKPEPIGFRCLVHLPPEYDPYRRYPLLISLPGGRQIPEQNLDMWCGGFNKKLGVRTGQAMRHGYVVMAIEWLAPGQSKYEYTAREHATVLKALRHALRKFSIDSDRVFLSGHGIGGDAAYDIGVSHPEHWAGIIGVTGKMDRYVDIYLDNQHVNLPVYSVVGERDFATIQENKNAWNRWLRSQRYMDCTVVIYEGRGNELFPEEIPEIFKWTKAQRRRWPDKSGFKFECESIRPWDCYFWFLEFHGIPPEDTVWPEAWRDRGISTRMTIFGETKADDPNSFRIGPSSPRIDVDATLWLSPEYVNFNDEIRIKGRGKAFKGSVAASTEILLEDVRRRADREHPFWSRIDCVDGIWQSGH